MQKDFYVNHHQDLTDAASELKGLRFPYLVMAKSMPPTKEHEDEYEKKRKQMAYWFRSVVPCYSECAGLTEEHARAELQIKLSRCGEININESGEFDVVWLEDDKMRVVEQGKQYYVQSIAAMSNCELSALVDKAKNYILQMYGVAVREIINNKSKLI